MALTASLSAVTASDATFSAAGATAWLTVTGRTATIAGSASVAQGGTGLSTIAALSTWVTNALDTPLVLTPGAGQSIRINAGNTAWEAYTPAAAGATLNGVTAATGAVTIASGNNTGIVWNWANTTNTTVCHTFGETSAATNGTSTSGIPNQVLVKLTTVASSTQSPLSVYQRGTHVFSVDPTNPQILANSGTAANPSYSFAGATTSGMIFAASELQFIYAGAQAFACYKTGTLGQLLASDRAASFASPHFSNDGGTPDTGFNLNANVIGVAVSGIENSRFVAGAFQPSKGSGDAVSYAVNFRKARGTVASPTVITTGDVLSTQSSFAYLGATNTYRETGRWECTSKGTISDATDGVGSIWTLYGKTQGTDATVAPALVVTDGSTATIKFAGTGMFTANGSTIATIGATCPGSATVVKWFTFTDSTGTVCYVPCF